MSLVGNGNLPRLLVVGARGFLGNFIVDQAGAAYKVIRGDRTRESGETDVAIDITDPSSVRSTFANVRPDVVILLAAISDIDRCQREPEQAFAVNLHGAESVANACAGSGSRLLFTSTGAVFNGRQHGYHEDDPVTPVSIYGETKAEAELVVRSLVPNSLILRVSLVLGRAGRPGTNSLLDAMIGRWQKGEALSASVVESRNPIDASTLSQWMLELLADEQLSGTFHTGATESMSRFELAQAIAASLQVSPDLVKPELHPPAGRAPRGADHLLLTEKINKACATKAPSCKQVIERSLNEVAESSLRTGV
jgi:dTDP-4-dehydrorhamnose reductase